MKKKDMELFEDEAGEERPPTPNLARTLAKALNYTFERAIADLIDNSISHNAQNVWVYIDHKNGKFDYDRAFVSIVDDGDGMSAQHLSKSLEYGHDSKDEATNLGAFGLGMKTASTSQSWVIAVATRDKPNEKISCRAWDIPWIEGKGKWKLRIVKAERFPSKVIERISEHTGTTVFLPDLTRIKPNINELSAFNQEQFLAPKIEACKKHLQCVFHRFISGKTLSEEFAGRKVNMFLNDIPIEPWDPFMEDHEEHQDFLLGDSTISSLMHLAPNLGNTEPLSLTLQGNVMRFRMHILPKIEESDPLHTIAGGVKKWNQQQGVYFYRSDRLIQSGGWCGLLSCDEHNKLARLSIDVNRDWDELIELTATKNRIIVPDSPSSFRSDFKKIFGKLRGKARSVYDRVDDDALNGGGGSTGNGGGSTGNGGGSTGNGGGSTGNGGGSTGNGGGSTGNGGGSTGNGGGSTGRRPRRHRLDDQTVERLLDACENDDEKNVIMKVYTRAKRS
jgi:hypothetical protein